MEYILQGYQCGSVYKPIYLETQDAVALATILRAGQTPPPGSGQRHHDTSEERVRFGSARVAADPHLGDCGEHERRP